jgi:hypothetical protein
MAKETLTKAGLNHVWIKGAALREQLYAEPFRRPADDIDLLIAPGDRDAAIDALTRAGFRHTPKPANLTHETNLHLGGACLDLHWALMRPARLRTDPVAAFLADRQPIANGWAPPDALHPVLLLTHPVFTKYATTPQARLIRAVDLVHLLHGTPRDQPSLPTRSPPDWEAVMAWLERIGLKTAAWITLLWLEAVTGRQPCPDAILAALAPGPLRRRWLALWLERDLPSRLAGHPWLIQLGLTLPAQDGLGDAWRLLRDRARERAPTVNYGD